MHGFFYSYWEQLVWASSFLAMRTALDTCGHCISENRHVQMKYLQLVLASSIRQRYKMTSSLWCISCQCSVEQASCYKYEMLWYSVFFSMKQETARLPGGVITEEIAKQTRAAQKGRWCQNIKLATHRWKTNLWDFSQSHILISVEIESQEAWIFSIVLEPWIFLDFPMYYISGLNKYCRI